MSNIKTYTAPDGSIITKLDNRATTYRKYGRYHREDGPAYYSSWGEVWWLNGNIHRIDGPARKLRGSDHEYFIKGVMVPPFTDISDIIPFNTETAISFYPVERIVNMKYYVISLQGQGDHEIKLVRQDGWDSLENHLLTVEMREDFKAAYNVPDSSELEDFFISLRNSNSSSIMNDIALNIPPASHNGEMMHFFSMSEYTDFLRANPKLIIEDEYTGYIY